MYCNNRTTSVISGGVQMLKYLLKIIFIDSTAVGCCEIYVYFIGKCHILKCWENGVALSHVVMYFQHSSPLPSLPLTKLQCWRQASRALACDWSAPTSPPSRGPDLEPALRNFKNRAYCKMAVLSLNIQRVEKKSRRK